MFKISTLGGIFVFVIMGKYKPLFFKVKCFCHGNTKWVFIFVMANTNPSFLRPNVFFHGNI